MGSASLVGCWLIHTQRRKFQFPITPPSRDHHGQLFGYSLPVFFFSPFLFININTLNKVMNPLHVLLLLTLLRILNPFPESMYFSTPGLLLAQRQINHCSPFDCTFALLQYLYSNKQYCASSSQHCSPSREGFFFDS